MKICFMVGITTRVSAVETKVRISFEATIIKFFSKATTMKMPSVAKLVKGFSQTTIVRTSCVCGHTTEEFFAGQTRQDILSGPKLSNFLRCHTSQDFRRGDISKISSVGSVAQFFLEATVVKMSNGHNSKNSLWSRDTEGFLRGHSIADVLSGDASQDSSVTRLLMMTFVARRLKSCFVAALVKISSTATTVLPSCGTTRVRISSEATQVRRLLRPQYSGSPLRPD